MCPDWTAVLDAPLPRFGASMTVIQAVDGHPALAFVFGGYHSLYNLSPTGMANDLWVINITTVQSRWVQLKPTGDVPGERCLHASVFYNRTIYIVGSCPPRVSIAVAHCALRTGGLSSFSPVASIDVRTLLMIMTWQSSHDRIQDFYSLNVDTFVWTKLMSGPTFPLGHRGAFSGVVADGLLYFFGGLDTSGAFARALGDLWSYNTVTNQFQRVSAQAPIVARYAHSFNVVSGGPSCPVGILVVGGIGNLTEGFLDSSGIFCINSQSWIVTVSATASPRLVSRVLLTMTPVGRVLKAIRLQDASAMSLLRFPR
jgi:hypothetical protein